MDASDLIIIAVIFILLAGLFLCAQMIMKNQDDHYKF